MAQHLVARRKSHPVRNVLLVLLVVILVYLGCAGYSLYRIYGSAETAQQTYSELQSSLAAGQLDEALQETHNLCSTMADIGDEADSWVWVVAGYVPWIGEDVEVGRGLADVSDSLCNEALLPVVEQYEAISSGSGSVSGTADAITQAAEVVSSCSETLSSLGTSHFSQLNDAKAELTQAVSSVEGSLSSVASAIGAIGSLVGAVTSLAG